VKVALLKIYFLYIALKNTFSIKLITEIQPSKSITQFSETLMPSDFEKAVVINNYKLVSHDIEWYSAFPVNARNEQLQTGLMLACQHKSFETAEVFFKDRSSTVKNDLSICNPNLVDASGWTALHYAAQSGSLECVSLLIAHKAEIDATTNKYETALFLATNHNHPDIVEFLAEKKCLLQTKARCKKPKNDSFETQITALEVAVANNFVEIATCLLFHLNTEKGLNEKDLYKLLVIAAKKGHIKIASQLIINGANVNHLEGIIIITFNVFKNCII
jgi:ankyrin repeat protein